MTTKIKKKGVLGISGSSTKEKQSCLQLQDQERESLQFKSTNPLQETEKCSWPKTNLAVPSPHKNPEACNNLDFRTQRNFPFLSCKDLDH